MNELVRDDGTHNKYFHVLPNMYDDDLNPYEYRLMGHFKRVGISWEGTRKIAKITKMSVGMVTKTRKALEAKQLISVEFLTRKDLKDRGLVDDEKPDESTTIAVTTVIDVMAQNIARYQKMGVHVVNTPVHGVNGSVHGVNERITNEEEPVKKRGTHAKTRTPRQDLIKSLPDQLIDIWAHETKWMGNDLYRWRWAAKKLLELMPPASVSEIETVCRLKMVGRKTDYEFRYLLDDIPQRRDQLAQQAREADAEKVTQARVDEERRRNRILWGLEQGETEGLADAS